jgi:outer membrane receptor protein involved in Fe transport
MSREQFFLIVGLLSAGQAASAHETSTELLEEVIVYGRSQQMIGAASAASEGVVGYDDIRLPPMLRVGELVEAVPGMVATQHSGTGKANQYFLRGFNLDHGTDFSAFVDGVPVNLRTHGHGQGYLDLNFIIPELVETTRYRKGPYATQSGDFSSAGSVEFGLYDALDESVLTVTAGAFDYYRALAAGSAEAGSGTLTAAYDYTSYAGPWEIDEDLSQTRFHASYATTWRQLKTRVSLLGYSGHWNASDQIPQRAVDSGLIDRRGYIDPDLGGKTDRIGLTGSAETDNWKATAYVVDYDFELFSNFTYLLDDPAAGDQFEQVDDRRIYGARFEGWHEHYQWPVPLTVSWGGDVRYDDISEVGLFSTVERTRNQTIRQDTVDELSASAYGELDFRYTDDLRVSLGLRADYLSWDVSALRPVNSGSGDDFLFSPKFNLAWKVASSTELYLNWGHGFHSNDVRGNTITVDPLTGDPVDRVDPSVKSEGAEVGLRFEWEDRFNATLTTFWLTLDSELLFVGDAGGTEAQGASTRMGVEFSTFLQATDWLAINFAYTYTDSEFDDAADENKIPGAIGSSGTLGLNGAWNNGFFTSARVRYLGSAPLIEDNSVRSSSSLLVNAGAGYRVGAVELRLDVLNVFDSGDYDISYSYASRLEQEPLDGVEDIHFRPLEPRSVRASISYHW